MFYVYLIESEKNGELYTGYTDNLKRRLEEHNKGKNRYTKKDKSWKVIYYEACIEESDAKRREKYLKHNKGRQMLKRRIKDYLNNRRLAD